MQISVHFGHHLLLSLPQGWFPLYRVPLLIHPFRHTEGVERSVASSILWHAACASTITEGWSGPTAKFVVLLRSDGATDFAGEQLREDML